jgi:secondary thiamine-phosphate synthase enzyme
MEAVVPTRGFRHAHIRIATDHPTEFVDLTDRLKALVVESGIRFGLLNVQSFHTTTAIVVNENEPLLLGDFRVMLEIIAPSNLPYRHDDLAARTVNVVADERVNGHAHCRAVLLGLSACLNIIDGTLQLGEWQRVFLAELDGPRERQISVLILGESGR